MMRFCFLGLAVCLAAFAPQAKAGNCQAGLQFRQLSVPQYYAVPLQVVPVQVQQVAPVQLQAPAPVQVQQAPAVQAPAPVVLQAAPVVIQQASPVYVQQVAFAQVGHVQSFGFRGQNFGNGNFRNGNRFAVNQGQNVQIRPTGLARLLGVGGPDISIGGGGRGGVSVQPTGLARLLGTGGPRINVR